MRRINWSLYDNCRIGCDDCGVTQNNKNNKNSINSKNTIIDKKELAPWLLQELENIKENVQLQFYKDGDPIEININLFNKFLSDLDKEEKIKEIHLSSVLASFSSKSINWLNDLNIKKNNKKISWAFSINEINTKIKLDEKIIETNVKKLREIGIKEIQLRTFKHRSGYPNKQDEDKLKEISENNKIQLIIIENNVYPDKLYRNIEFYSDCGIN